ncbi:MAG: PhoH family protein [Betaproteobacteria bacterium]|nr:PhoH family protein [Betaproteobacteria bacterium]NBT11474.1 PhoH family protein [Betaproteobacteria bacterium]NBU49596.1 PhoH family protein [Betaproteobacteria bacterium]
MILQHTLPEDDLPSVLRVCGPLDENLRAIERVCGVRLLRRAAQIRIEGDTPAVQRAAAALQEISAQSRGGELSAERLAWVLRQAQPGPEPRRAPAQEADAPAQEADAPAQPVLHTRRADLQGRTPNQVDYMRHILGHDLTFGVGPAGTGKTFLAVACAVDALERHQVQRVVLTRPAVEAGERLGFLPGDLSQKVDPYLRPLYDALYELMGFDRVTRAFEKGLLEIAPLAFMRGRTLNHSFVILDEAQNTTPEQMKMFLTRIGFGSKAVITGDTSQVDLPRGITSGLLDAWRVLRKVQGIAFTEFTSSDVVRHPLVSQIVQAYEDARGHSAVRGAAGRGGR